MSFGIGEAIGGVLGYMGTRETNDANRDMFNEANNFSAQQAQLNREFQERMSGSAYQRAVNDMKWAGLNPMLAYSQGGASTPGGTSASSIAAPRMENANAAAVQSAMQLATTQNVKADTDQKEATAELTRAQTETERGRPANVAADTDRIRKDAELKVRQADLTDTQNKQAQAEIQRIFAATTNLDAQTALTRVNEILQKYDIPRMKAESQYFKTPIGKDSPHNKYGPQTPFRFFEGIGERMFNSARQIDDKTRPSGCPKWQPKKGDW